MIDFLKPSDRIPPEWRWYEVGFTAIVIVVCIGIVIFAGYQIMEMWKANVREEIRSSLQLQNQALLTANANSDCCPPARNGKLRQAARCLVLENGSVVMYCRYE